MFSCCRNWAKHSLFSQHARLNQKMQTQHFLQTISLLCCVFCQLQATSALQCYYCENCDENEDLQELHICEELPVQNIETTTRNTLSNTENATTRRTTTTTISSNESTDYLEQSLEGEEEDYAELYISAAPNTSSTASSAGEETDDYDEEDFDYFMRKQHNNMQPKQMFQQSVCYMLTAMINDTILVNRGCTNLLNEQEEATCAALALPAAATIMDCELCDTNACNKLFNEITPSATAVATKTTICTYIHMLLVIMLLYRII